MKQKRNRKKEKKKVCEERTKEYIATWKRRLSGLVEWFFQHDSPQWGLPVSPISFCLSYWTPHHMVF